MAKYRYFSEYEIENAPEWMAQKMLVLNEINLLLDDSRFIMIVGTVGVFVGATMVFLDRLWLGLTAEAIGFLMQFLAGRMMKKVDLLIKEHDENR